MAGKKKDNMFGSFAASAQQRKQEQEQIEATVMGRPAPAAATVQDRTTITLSISREDKALLKSWAAVHGTTMSDLLHDWIIKNCIEG